MMLSMMFVVCVCDVANECIVYGKSRFETTDRSEKGSGHLLSLLLLHQKPKSIRVPWYSYNHYQS